MDLSTQNLLLGLRDQMRERDKMIETLSKQINSLQQQLTMSGLPVHQGQAPLPAQPNSTGESPALLPASSNVTGNQALSPAALNPMSNSPSLLPTSPNPVGGSPGLLPAQSNPSVGSPGLLPAVPNPPGGQVLLTASSNPTAGSPALLPAPPNPTGNSPRLLPAAPNSTGRQMLSATQSNPTVCSPAILPAAQNHTTDSPRLLPATPNPIEAGTALLAAPPAGGDPVPAPPNSTGDGQALLAAQPNPTGDTLKVPNILIGQPSQPHPTGDTQKVPNVLVGQPSQPMSQVSITAIPVDAYSAPKDYPPGNPVSVHSSALSNTIPQLPQDTTEDQQQLSILDDDPFWPGYWSASVPMSEIPSSEAPINYSLAPMDLSSKQKPVPAHAVGEQAETNIPEKSKDVKPEDEANKKDGSETKPEVDASTSGAPNNNASSVQSHMAQNSSTEPAAPVTNSGQVYQATTLGNNNNTKEQFNEKVVLHQAQEQIGTRVSTSTESTLAKASTESPDSIVLPGIGDQTTSSGNITAKTTQIVPNINDAMEDDETSEFLVQQYLLKAYIKRLQNHQSLRRTRFPFPMAELLKSLDSENELNEPSVDRGPGNAANTSKTTDENMNSGEFGLFSRLLQNYYQLQKERSVLNEQRSRNEESTSGQPESSSKSQQEMEVEHSSKEKNESLNENLEKDPNAESLTLATSPKIADSDQLEEESIVVIQTPHQQNQEELTSHVAGESASSQGSTKRNIETIDTEESITEDESPVKRLKMSPANESAVTHNEDEEADVIFIQSTSPTSHVTAPGSTNELRIGPSTVETDTATSPPVYSWMENQTVTQPHSLEEVKMTRRHSQRNSIKKILDEPDTTLQSPTNTMQLQNIMPDKNMSTKLHQILTADTPMQSEIQTQVAPEQVSDGNIPIAKVARKNSQRQTPSGSNNAATQTSDSEDVSQHFPATSAPPITDVQRPEIPATQPQTVVKKDHQTEDAPSSFSTTSASQITDVLQTETVVRMKEAEDAPSLPVSPITNEPQPQTPSVGQSQAPVKINQTEEVPSSFQTASTPENISVPQPQTPVVQSQTSMRMKEVDSAPPSFQTTSDCQIIGVQQPQTRSVQRPETVVRKKEVEDAPPPYPTTSASQLISVHQLPTPTVQKSQTLVRMTEVERPPPPYPKTSASQVTRVQQPQIPIVQKSHTLVKMRAVEDAVPPYPKTSAFKVTRVQQPQTHIVQKSQTLVKMTEVEDVPPPYSTTSASQILNEQQPQKQQTVVRMKEVEDAAAPSFPPTPASRTITPTVLPQTLLRMKQVENAPPFLATASGLKVIIVPNVGPQQAVTKTNQIVVSPESVPQRPRSIVNQALFTQYQQTSKEPKQFEQQISQIQQKQQFSQSSQQQRLHNQQLFLQLQQQQQQEQPQTRFTTPQNLSSLKPIPLNKIVEQHHQQMVGRFGHQQLTGPRQQLKPAEAGGGKRPLLQMALKEQDAHFRALESQAKRYKSRARSEDVISEADTQKQTIVKLPSARVVIDRIQVPNQVGSDRKQPSKTLAAGDQSALPTPDKMRTPTPSQQQQQQKPSQFSPETETKIKAKDSKQIKSKPIKGRTEAVEDVSPKNKTPKAMTKRKWKVAPDSQQKEGVVTRLRFQKDNAAKKLNPPRTQYAQKLRSAQVQQKQKQKETKTKRTYDAFWNENGEIIKDMLTESNSHDGNDKCSSSHKSKVKAIVQRMDEEDNDGNISDFEETSSEPEIGKKSNPIQAKSHSGQDELSDHQESHAEVFTCDHCGKSFEWLELLQTHMKEHTGEKPFECEVCHKKFTWTSNLTNHMKTHPEVKQYTCKTCKTSYKSSWDLKRHIMYIHSNSATLLRCGHCRLLFKNKDEMRQHMKSHLYLNL